MSKVTNIRSEEELMELKVNRLKRGLTTIAVVAVGAGLYGFKIGRKAGYTRGVKDGYLTAGKEVLDAWREVKQLEYRVLDLESILEVVEGNDE